MPNRNAAGVPVSRRERAALATRQEILSAARRLFAERGFANTSIQQIASEAGVAVQTIYSSVGSKPALVIALNDLIDEEAGVAETAASLATTNDPRQMLALGVHLTRLINERCGDIITALLSAQAANAEAAAAVADGMHRHQQGISGIVRRLDELDALAADIDHRRATAAMTMMLAPTSWRQLTQESGWSFDEAEKWLVDALAKLLIVG